MIRTLLYALFKVIGWPLKLIFRIIMGIGVVGALFTALLAIFYSMSFYWWYSLLMVLVAALFVVILYGYENLLISVHPDNNDPLLVSLKSSVFPSAGASVVIIIFMVLVSNKLTATAEQHVKDKAETKQMDTLKPKK